ncbi:hypothetical protein BLNAU_15110 [Blattamonas nauphoetae]|uniref:Uncharacterized protein n=1 Tax=Blattamonas nauphoetae TaxID=2049346 RepID=A0ABQ9XF49_9EUKA|nr:hypothetical protein BLNAU_15110 [Blattamonas nauphoetae]
MIPPPITLLHRLGRPCQTQQAPLVFHPPNRRFHSICRAISKPKQSIRNLSKVGQRNPNPKTARSPSSLVQHDRDRRHPVSQSQSTSFLPKLPPSSSQRQSPQIAQKSPKTFKHRYSSPKLPKAPTPLATLPLLAFPEDSHYFFVDCTTLTRTNPAHFTIRSSTATTNVRSCSFKVTDSWSAVFLPDPFTSGVVSITITITILSTANGTIRFGLMDSKSRFLESDDLFGINVENSVGLDTDGRLILHTPSSYTIDGSHSRMKEGDCVRVEVNLDSTPRTVQLFVNGEAVMWYFSAYGNGTSFRIDNISRLSRRTPISKEMRKIRW